MFHNLLPFAFSPLDKNTCAASILVSTLRIQKILLQNYKYFMKMVVKTPATVFSTASGSRMIVLTHFVCCTTHVSGPRYSQLIMDTSDTESDLEVIPMKRCSGQRSKSLPFDTLRTSTTGSAPNVGNLLLQGAGHQPPTTLKVRKSKLFCSKDKMFGFLFQIQAGLQFLETSHNEIVYKTKKVEYILEKERRARRGSQPTNEMTKMAKFKLWVTSKVI